MMKMGLPLYNKYSESLKQLFGAKVYKLCIDLGQSCPHRSKSDREKGGCYYCNPDSFMPSQADSSRNIHQQLQEGAEKYHKKKKGCKFLVYFQAYTSTMETTERLRESFDEALSFEGVVGIAISTRPDTLSEEMLELIKEYGKKTYFLLEIGLESIHEKSLRFLGRNHPYSNFIDCIDRISACDVETCVHLITGIPGETTEDIAATAQEMARLQGVHGVKLHHFHVVKNTPFEKLYNNGSFALRSLDDTVQETILFVENLRPDQKIHRLTGDCNAGFLVAPRLSLSKMGIMNRIEAEMKADGTQQGRKYQIPN
ncbi:MAG: TIGR01212 family radical SAM protein [Nitrospinae bacterium]|nr:TIGR01212 family radical SAM protein [Nitrospinota bacterium]